MSAKVEAVVFGAILLPATIVVGVVIAIAGDQIRKWRNETRRSR